MVEVLLVVSRAAMTEGSNQVDAVVVVGAAADLVSKGQDRTGQTLDEC